MGLLLLEQSKTNTPGVGRKYIPGWNRGPGACLSRFDAAPTQCLERPLDRTNFKS